jgi:hypothetical protein
VGAQLDECAGPDETGVTTSEVLRHLVEAQRQPFPSSSCRRP